MLILCLCLLSCLTIVRFGFELNVQRLIMIEENIKEIRKVQYEKGDCYFFSCDAAKFICDVAFTSDDLPSVMRKGLIMIEEEMISSRIVCYAARFGEHQTFYLHEQVFDVDSDKRRKETKKNQIMVINYLCIINSVVAMLSLLYIMFFQEQSLEKKKQTQNDPVPDPLPPPPTTSNHLVDKKDV